MRPIIVFTIILLVYTPLVYASSILGSPEIQTSDKVREKIDPIYITNGSRQQTN